MSRTRRDRAVAAVCLAHLALVPFAWLRAAGAGTVGSSAASLALAVSVTAVAAVVAAVAWRHRGPERGHGILSLAFVTAMLPVQALLLAGMGGAQQCYESSAVSGVMLSTDRQWRVNLRICEPYRQHHFTRLDLTRISDRRRWTIPLDLRRTETDVVSRSEQWARLAPLGDGLYWLSLSTAVARSGPQFFSVDTKRDPPEVEEITRGLTLEDGRARWDCDVWADDAPGADPLATVCDGTGIPMPHRACAMSRLVESCDERLPLAVSCRPTLGAGEDALECLGSLAKGGMHDAWDALVLALLEGGLPERAESASRRAMTVASDERTECREARDAARRTVIARRLGHSDPERQAAVDLLRLAESGGWEGCDAGLEEFASVLSSSREQFAWRVAEIDREWGFVGRSCRSVGDVASGSGLRRLPEETRREITAWASACRERQSDVRASAP